jgi:hypothetical protein
MTEHASQEPSHGGYSRPFAAKKTGPRRVRNRRTNHGDCREGDRLHSWRLAQALPDGARPVPGGSGGPSHDGTGTRC